MANDTPKVIQKDLGIVTAYGYALAGGYQGTEAQFIQDFNAMISGQYNALGNKPSINGVTLQGNKTSANLGLQNALTAGENITIVNDVISATGGGGGSFTFEQIDVSDYFIGENTAVVEAKAFVCGSLTYLAAAIQLGAAQSVSAFGFLRLGQPQDEAYIVDYSEQVRKKITPKIVHTSSCTAFAFSSYGTFGSGDEHCLCHIHPFEGGGTQVTRTGIVFSVKNISDAVMHISTYATLQYGASFINQT